MSSKSPQYRVFLYQHLFARNLILEFRVGVTGLAHSMKQYDRAASVVRPSVRLSVCPSVCKHFAQIASSTRKMAGSHPNLRTMVSRSVCIQGMLKFKVEVKGHVIPAHFPAFSWVLSLWLAGWLVGGKSCRVSVRAIN